MMWYLVKQKNSFIFTPPYALMIWCIEEVLGTNLGLVTGCPEQVFHDFPQFSHTSK